MAQPRLVGARATLGGHTAVLELRIGKGGARRIRTVRCKRGKYTLRIGGNIYGGEIIADNLVTFEWKRVGGSNENGESQYLAQFGKRRGRSRKRQRQSA